MDYVKFSMIRGFDYRYLQNEFHPKIMYSETPRVEKMKYNYLKDWSLQKIGR